MARRMTLFFLVMLQIAESPGSISSYLNDPEIGNMLLQISRIYHAEKDSVARSSENRRESELDHRHEETLLRQSASDDFDDDSDWQGILLGLILMNQTLRSCSYLFIDLFIFLN